MVGQLSGCPHATQLGDLAETVAKLCGQEDTAEEVIGV
jgi:hypothetical protein